MSLLDALIRTDHPAPVIDITVDGTSLNSLIRPRLIRLTHTDNRGFEADTLELELDDSDGALDLPPRGAEIALAFGWKKAGPIPKGTYTVDEVTHGGAPDVLTIRAKSADLRAGLSQQHERSWHATTLGAIVRTIASENDLQAVIPASLANQAIDHIDQTNESGANLLTRLAQQFDAIATVKDGRLLFMPAGGGITASGRPIPPVVITRQSGDRHQFAIADRATYTAVRALWHDVGLAIKGELIWGNAEDAAERNKPVATTAAPTTGQYKAIPGTYASRAKALKAAQKAWKALKANKAKRAAWIGTKASYDDRNLKVTGSVTYGQADDDKKQRAAQRQATRDADKIATANAFNVSADNLKTLRHVYSSKANAARAARAEWRRLQRGMATFTITIAEGIPELFPETPAIVSGFKPQIDSTDWLITRVVNTIGDAGYTQQIEFEIKATEIPD